MNPERRRGMVAAGDGDPVVVALTDRYGRVDINFDNAGGMSE